MEPTVELELDKRGRMTLPVEIRKKFGIKAGDRVRIEIKGVEQRKGFIELCDRCLKGAGDAVKLKHEAIKFGVKRHLSNEVLRFAN